MEERVLRKTFGTIRSNRRVIGCGAIGMSRAAQIADSVGDCSGNHAGEIHHSYVEFKQMFAKHIYCLSVLWWGSVDDRAGTAGNRAIRDEMYRLWQ